jgi:uncharacterized protein YbbK (DUF523 family)
VRLLHELAKIGLGTPRETLRLNGTAAWSAAAGPADHTAAMAALPVPGPGLDGYVFKAKSPSCGIGGIPRYAASCQPADLLRHRPAARAAAAHHRRYRASRR